MSGRAGMSRRNAFRQCDVERAIRAAKATGAGRVEVRPDGTIAIEVERATGSRQDHPQPKDFVLW